MSSAGTLNFAIGLTGNDQFVDGLSRSQAALDGVKNRTALMASGMYHAGGEMMGARERVEILRHSLDGMGGSFAALGGLSRMMLDPMTIGFAAVFAAVELVNKSLEESEKKCELFGKELEGFGNILKGINDARPTDTKDWADWIEQFAKLSEKTPDIKAFAEAFNDVQKGIEANNADAADEQLAVEQQKIELLRKQGQISAADAAKRIEALKDQAVLQKNLTERKGIQNEISRREAELAQVRETAAKSPSVGTALDQKIKADNRVADLNKQMDDLPKAIAENKKIIETASANYKSAGFINPHERADWYSRGEDAKQRNLALENSLATAKNQFPGAVKKAAAANEDFETAKNYKSRGGELEKIIGGLKNKLGVTVDRQKKLTPIQFEKNHLEAITDGLMGNKPGKVDGGTQFEKMGFVMNGTGNLASEQVKILREISAKLNNKPKVEMPPLEFVYKV